MSETAISMIRWDNIDTTLEGGSRQLDRAIAERMGWMLLCAPVVDDERGEFVWEWHNPAGRRCGWTFKIPSSIDDFFFAYPQHEIPHFSSDLNAAWTLLNGIQTEITIKNYPDNQRVVVSFWDKVWHSDSTPPPATAICLAWLRQWDYLHAIGKAFQECQS